jgi:hypothetical protein
MSRRGVLNGDGDRLPGFQYLPDNLAEYSGLLYRCADPRSGHKPDKFRIVDSTTNVLESQNLTAARPFE